MSNRKKRDNTQDDEPLEKDPITYNVSNNKEAKKVTMDKKKVARDNKNVTGTDNSLSPDERNATVDSNSDNSTRPVFNQIVVYGTEIEIPNLGHFQEYNIQVCCLIHLVNFQKRKIHNIHRNYLNVKVIVVKSHFQ